MEFLDWQSILPFLGGIIVAFLTGLFGQRKSTAESRKAHAEAESSLSSATMEWAREVKKGLEERIASLSRRLDRLERENQALKKQILEAGLVPTRYHDFD